jgi:hypothetical protein
MAQGLVGRVNETHVILPGPDQVDVGEWIQFAVTLYDGTPGFAGVGRCVTVVDNGEERLSHQRFDVVIDSLQFDPRGQQIFEHILMLNGADPAAAADGYAEQGEYADAGNYADAAADAIPEDTGAFVDVSSELMQQQSEPALAYAEPAVADAGYAEDDYGAASEEQADATMVGSRAELEAVMASAAAEEPSFAADDDDDEAGVPTAPPPAGSAVAQAVTPTAPPPPGSVQPQAMYRTDKPPAVNGHSHPPAAPVRVPRSANGMSFKYHGGLPFPAVPPRPELDATRRVRPAPRPRA